LIGCQSSHDIDDKINKAVKTRQEAVESGKRADEFFATIAAAKKRNEAANVVAGVGMFIAFPVVVVVIFVLIPRLEESLKRIWPGAKWVEFVSAFAILVLITVAVGIVAHITKRIRKG
jgi:hypothetical protein